jgi:hypothetical protein
MNDKISAIQFLTEKLEQKIRQLKQAQAVLAADLADALELKQKLLAEHRAEIK